MKAVSTKMVAIVMTPEPKELTPSSNNIMNGHNMIKITLIRFLYVLHTNLS